MTPPTMKRYSVTIPIHGSITYSDVEAESEKAAEEVAWAKFHDGDESYDIEWETRVNGRLGDEVDVSEEKP